MLAWKLIKDEYEPKVAGRYATMLGGLLNPEYFEEEMKKGKDFMEVLGDWEVDVARYELQSSEKVSANTRVAVIMKYAPENVKVALRQRALVFGNDFKRLGGILFQCLVSGRD